MAIHTCMVQSHPKLQTSPINQNAWSKDPPLKPLPLSVDLHKGRPPLSWPEPPASLQIRISCDAKGSVCLSAFGRLHVATLDPLRDLGSSPEQAEGGAIVQVGVTLWFMMSFVIRFTTNHFLDE